MEIINDMEKALKNIKSYYEDKSFPDIVKLREIEYRLGVIYGYGKILERIDNENFWKFHTDHIGELKEYESFCRKVVSKYRRCEL